MVGTYLVRHVGNLVLAVGSFLGDLRRRRLTLLELVLVRPGTQCFLKRALEDLGAGLELEKALFVFIPEV